MVLYNTCQPNNLVGWHWYHFYVYQFETISIRIWKKNFNTRQKNLVHLNQSCKFSLYSLPSHSLKHHCWFVIIYAYERSFYSKNLFSSLFQSNSSLALWKFSLINFGLQLIGIHSNGKFVAYINRRSYKTQGKFVEREIVCWKSQQIGNSCPTLEMKICSPVLSGCTCEKTTEADFVCFCMNWLSL